MDDDGDETEPANTPAVFPPLAEQAAHLMGDVAAAVRSGGERVTYRERVRRLTICAGAGDVPKCDFFTGSRCLRCGCHLNFKARLKAWHCPLDPPKW